MNCAEHVDDVGECVSNSKVRSLSETEEVDCDEILHECEDTRSNNNVGAEKRSHAAVCAVYIPGVDMGVLKGRLFSVQNMLQQLGMPEQARRRPCIGRAYSASKDAEASRAC